MGSFAQFVTLYIAESYGDSESTMIPYTARCSSPGVLRKAMKNIQSNIGMVYELSSETMNITLVLEANQRLDLVETTSTTAKPTRNPTVRVTESIQKESFGSEGDDGSSS